MPESKSHLDLLRVEKLLCVANGNEGIVGNIDVLHDFSCYIMDR